MIEKGGEYSIEKTRTYKKNKSQASKSCKKSSQDESNFPFLEKEIGIDISLMGNYRRITAD